MRSRPIRRTIKFPAPAPTPAKKPGRDGTDECFRYLGEIGALMFFCRAALDPDATGKALLDWTRRLQAALLAQYSDAMPHAGSPAQPRKSDPPPLAPSHLPARHPDDARTPFKIDPPQISTWRGAKPIVWASPNETTQPLSLRVLALEIVQATEGTPGWRGHLLVVYDPRTETLAHRFLKVRRSAEVSSDWILHGLAKADAAIRKRTSARRLAQDAVLIQLPDLQDMSLPYAAAYAEAAARIRAAIPNGGLSATWLAQHVAPLTLYNAQVDVGAPRSAIAELTVETARAFSNALIRAARTFTAECGADGPAWIALNPQKGNIDRRPGWAEDERRRRLTAASQNEDKTC